MAREFEIPGGTASFTTKDERTVGQDRRITAATVKAKKFIESAALAVNGDIIDGDTPSADVDASKDAQLATVLDMTEDDLGIVWNLNDTMILALLESWTIDRPLPKTAEDIENLPGPLYKALQDAVAELSKADAADQFSVDAVEDKDSPTGA